jgi:uncharacterized membrane protein YphA (DoxX/SURF4 family)
MKERLALVFLVLLRMAIGWHFLFEAVEKHRSVFTGPTETNRPWTSEGFFREGRGPVATLVRGQLVDMDDMTLARLDIGAIPSGEDASKYPPHRRMPPALDKEWNAYLARFTQAYELDAPEAEVASKKLDQQKGKLVESFTTKKKEFKRAYPSGTLDVNLTVIERTNEYREKLRDYRNRQDVKLWAMGKDVEKSSRNALRAEIGNLRAELTKEIDDQTAEMRKALDDTVKDSVSKQQTLNLQKTEAKPQLIAFIDWSTRWGLTIIGACLLLGLFTRSASFGGALFLLMTILTAPSLPWLPAPPMAEGNYVFVSKNVIEMLALFMLAFMPTGRYFGIDALIHSFLRRKDDSD